MESDMLYRGYFLGAVLFLMCLVPYPTSCIGPCEATLFSYEPVAEGHKNSAQIELKCKQFLKKHAADPLVTVWPKKPYIIGVLSIRGKLLYELTCGKFGPFDHSLTITPTQTFLLYENKKGSLSRINVSPHNWTGWTLGGTFKSETAETIQEFNRFLRTLPDFKAISKEEQAHLFVSLVCHDAPCDFPCVLYTSPISGPGRRPLPECLSRYATELEEKPSIADLRKKEEEIVIVAKYPITNSLVQFHMLFFSNEMVEVFLRRLPDLGF